jgi:arylformamidase
MAMFAQQHAPRAHAACLASGIDDLAPVLQISVGAEIHLDEDMSLRNSPTRRVRSVGIPLLIAVGALESPAWREQSIDFGRRCKQEGNDARLLIAPDAHHFSMGLDVPGSPLNEALVALALS